MLCPRRIAVVVQKRRCERARRVSKRRIVIDNVVMLAWRRMLGCFAVERRSERQSRHLPSRRAELQTASDYRSAKPASLP